MNQYFDIKQSACAWENSSPVHESIQSREHGTGNPMQSVETQLTRRFMISYSIVEKSRWVEQTIFSSALAIYQQYSRSSYPISSVVLVQCLYIDTILDRNQCNFVCKFPKIGTTEHSSALKFHPIFFSSFINWLLYYDEKLYLHTAHTHARTTATTNIIIWCTSQKKISIDTYICALCITMSWSKLHNCNISWKKKNGKILPASVNVREQEQLFLPSRSIDWGAKSWQITSDRKRFLFRFENCRKNISFP